MDLFKNEIGLETINCIGCVCTKRLECPDDGNRGERDCKHSEAVSLPRQSGHDVPEGSEGRAGQDDVLPARPCHALAPRVSRSHRPRGSRQSRKDKK